METQMHINEVNKRTGKSKVAQYGWEMGDRPGSLVWLNKSELLVDHSYQRAAKAHRVLALAANWSWVACGVIVVAKRNDDKRFYVIEGQHRVLAALKRSDIDQLPCIVFTTDGPKQEADGFYAANVNRRPVTSLEKWRTQIMRGDPTTLFADELIARSGRTPGNSASPTTVRCLTSVLRAVDSNRGALERVWPLVVETCDGQPLHEIVLEGLLWLEVHMPQDSSLTEKRWSERVLRVGNKGLLEGAKRAAAFYTRGGAKVWALGMLETINKGCRILLTIAEAEE